MCLLNGITNYAFNLGGSVMNRVLIIVFLFSLLTGCHQWFGYKPICIPKPERPELASVNAAELDVLPDDVYRRLVARDLGRKHYAEQLEVIVNVQCEGDL